MTLAHTHTVCISAWTYIERGRPYQELSIQIRGNAEECLFYMVVMGSL